MEPIDAFEGNIVDRYGGTVTAMQAHETADKALIDQFLRGDQDAFTAIYQAHHAAIFRFAFHMTGDTAVAAEIAQDVFVWLMHHAADFDPVRGGLAQFLAGVARKFLQKRRSAERRWLPFKDVLFRFVSREPSVDRGIDAGTVRTAIAALPLRYREAIVLCDLESRTYEEAAGVLCCAVGTVRSRLHRGRELLARKFQPNKETRR